MSTIKLRTLTPEAARVAGTPVPESAKLPDYLRIHWPLGGDLRVWGFADERIDYEPLAPATNRSEPGKELAGRFVALPALPEAIYLAWYDEPAGVPTVFVAELLSGEIETHPRPGVFLHSLAPRADGALWWAEKVTDTVTLWRLDPADGTPEQKGSAVVGSGGNSQIDAWHRNHFVTQFTLGGGQIAAIEPETGDFTTYGLLSTVRPGTGTKTPPVAAADRFANSALGSAYGGPFPYPGGKLRIHTGTVTSLYSAGFLALSSGDADALLDAASYPWAHARLDQSGRGLMCFPFDNPSRGKWFDPAESSSHSRNSTAIAIESFGLFDDSDPTSHPQAVIPLAAQPPWIEE